MEFLWIAPIPIAWQSLLLLPILCLVLAARVRYRSGLREVPGPFWASILPLDRILTAARGNQFDTHIGYHKKYGPYVRVGPNHISIANGDAIPQIYSITSKFDKSNFYPVFDAVTPRGNIPTTFSIRSHKEHRDLRRPVGAAFAMSSVLELEATVDDCTKYFMTKLAQKQDQNFDLGAWLHWYSFDVIAQLTFSKRFGFMEKETDIEGIIAALENRQVYSAIVGQAPMLHKFLFGNKFVSSVANTIPRVRKMNSSARIVEFAANQLRLRQEYDKENNVKDILARFKRYRDGSQIMTDQELLGHSATNVFAGSDTTAITLRAIFYYLMKNPEMLNQLVQEIREFESQGELSDIVTYAESQRMSYLQACIKEAMRLHPAVGFLLERVVPDEGANISGTYFPSGTVVGVNPWVVGREQAVYGSDADDFRPERWLEASKDTLKLMERNWLAFGEGSRTCLGKNISLMEISKLVPQLLRRYSFHLSDPTVDWKLFDYWFVRQEGLICKVTTSIEG